MNSVTITFHSSGQDYAVDFPNEGAAREWYNDAHAHDSTVAKRITLGEAERILGRTEDPYDD